MYILFLFHIYSTKYLAHIKDVYMFDEWAKELNVQIDQAICLLYINMVPYLKITHKQYIQSDL